MVNVFISWSGPKSKRVAEALRSWLPVVIQAISPWLSSSDIEAGARWAADVAGKLNVSKVGILCLTASNLDSIWVHFEAGALAKTLDSTFVIPYLIDVEPGEIKGPLAQFQALKADEIGTRRVVETINSALGENGLKPDTVRDAFEMAWPRLRKGLEEIPLEQSSKKRRSLEDMIEELLELARGQARKSDDAQIPKSLVSSRVVPSHHSDRPKKEHLIRQAVKNWIEAGMTVTPTSLEDLISFVRDFLASADLELMGVDVAFVKHLVED